jgi:hypothetical protein
MEGRAMESTTPERTGVGGTALGRIRKLLAKAERAGTPEEAQTYTEKAVELMARHGIDAALLAAARPGRDGIGATRVDVADPYSAGKARLLGWTAAALRCRAVLHQAGGGRVTAVTVFGFASDRERVEVLFTSLLLQATGQLVRGRPARAGESVAAYRRSWLHGFAVSVYRRLSDAEQRAAAAAGVHDGTVRRTELVLADRRAQVDRAYAEAFPALGHGRRPALSGSGFGAGAAAGEQADLGGPAVPPFARPDRAVGA